MNRFFAVLAAAGLASSASAQWTGVSLTDGDVRFQLPAGTAGGAALPAAFTSTTTSAVSYTADFRTTGPAGTDHVFSNWWWYRANNDTRERSLASVAGSNPVTRTTTGTNAVSYTGIQPEVTGANAGLRFDLQFIVGDLDGAGGNQGFLWSILTVYNTGSTVATGVNLFHYVDYFFTGEDAGDIVPAGEAGVDGTNRFIRVYDPSDATVPSFGHMLHYGYGATGFGVGSFSAVGGQMGDAGVDDFLDFNNATVAGDQSGVLQWSFGDIQPGGSRTAVSLLAIPAPSTAALLGLGGLVAARRRRN